MKVIERLTAMDPEDNAAAQLEALGVTLEQVEAELEYRRQARIKRAYAQQALAARAGGERRLLRGEDGGEVQFMVHPVFYHYWGQRLGYECWDDAQFVREFLRDNPAARIRNRVDRLTIVRPAVALRPEAARVPATPAQRAAAAAAAPRHSAPNPPPRRAVTGRRGRWAA